MRLTIAKRLVPVIITAVIGVALMAGVAQYMNDKVYSSTNYTNTNVIPSLVLLDEMRKDFLLARVVVYHMIIATNPTNREQQYNRVVAYRQKIDEAMTKYEFNGCYGISCISDETDKNLLYQEKARIREMDKSLSEAIAATQSGDEQKARAIMAASADLSQNLQLVFDQHFDYNVVIGRRSADQALHEKTDAFYFLLFVGLGTLIVISSMGFASTKSILNQLGGEPEDASAIAAKLSLGDLSTHIQLKDGDSTSLMAKMQQLIDTMEKVADRADAISRGNLTDEVTILSDKDRLGHAINHMVVALRTARNLDDRRNWLSNGNTQLSNALTGDYSTEEIASIAMSTIGRYIGAGRGVFYVMRKDGSALDLLASYMYTEDVNYRTSFRLGEGAIGQVALEQTPIILASINSSSAMIITGTTIALPTCTFTYPVLKDKKLQGVIEFSSLEPFSEIKLDYLSASIDVIASFMVVAEQRGQIHALLAAAEQAERDVRKQNEFLQEINSRMEEQQQQLQQQSEELQQTNAQMEEQHQLLEHNNEKLRQSETEINEKARQLELSNHYKSEFLANMSHELRTPLNAIILLSKMMLDNPDGNLTAKELKRADVIHHSGHDLLALINEVLDLSKVEAGRMEINSEEISTLVVSAELQDLFESTAQTHRIAFIIDDQLKDKFVSDRSKITQILRNLLSNAFKFTKQGSVTLTFQRQADAQLPIRIKVTDTGIGIAKSKHRTIFDAFRQVDGSISREYGGTGLGLTISLRFAELLGGEITLTSTEGKGSEFVLALPETVQPQSTTASAPLTSQPILKTHHIGLAANISQQSVADDRNNIQPDDKIILLIDDDPHFGNAVVEINQRLGYKTVVAQTGGEGLTLAARYRPAGILLDLGLPDKDGADVLHEIKSSIDLASIPVYIISGRDHDSALNQQGIVGYLQKPIVSSQIEEAEAALLNAIGNARTNAVLIVSQHVHNDISLKLATGPNQYDIHHAIPDKSLHQTLQECDWGVIIVDLIHVTIERGLEIAATIREHQPKSALLFFGNRHFNDDEEASLRAYSDSIIINAPHADQRLKENIERFLQNESRVDVPEFTSTNSTGQEKSLSEKNILVIDDDPRNLFVITAALEQNQARIYNALNGRRAMDMLEHTEVDLIITDIMMPEMDGYQTIAAIRANPKLKTIPIIALTAKAMPEDKRNILEIGADDYLSKPVDYSILCNMAAFWSSSKHVES
jgi:signal transduction histidine kinase/DNA-binding response OmpR family regulator